jgi:hypothetical protein
MLNTTSFDCPQRSLPLSVSGDKDWMRVNLHYQNASKSPMQSHGKSREHATGKGTEKATAPTAAPASSAAALALRDTLKRDRLDKQKRLEEVDALNASRVS